MPCFFIIQIYTQLVPCDYKYLLKIWKNSIRQKLEKIRKTDGRRQDFHLFTAFYLLFMVIEKRWRAARITFFRLIDKVYCKSLWILMFFTIFVSMLLWGLPISKCVRWFECYIYKKCDTQYGTHTSPIGWH